MAVGAMFVWFGQLIVLLVQLAQLGSASQLSQATETRNDYTVFSHNKKVGFIS
jgi:hypothetical protein